jgi:DNA polymerase
VGRSGQLLDRMLACIGLDRHAEDAASAVYIANILPWRPVANRTPSVDEANEFLPFIDRHVALIDPAVVVTMGNVSTKTLLATKTGIMRMRGTWTAYAASRLSVAATGG